MNRIAVKALSINRAYQGRRFSTPELFSFKKELFYLLPKGIQIPEGKLQVSYTFGVSSKESDGDNLIKAFQDCLADHYGFNDKKIYKWNVEKVDVEKGQEFICFKIDAFA